MIFTVQDRQETFDFILSIAKACEKIVALVQVGSGAVGFTDDHSDLDFVVALDSNDSMKEVMDYFHQKVSQKYEIIYHGQIELRRLEVFVLSNLLEIDLGFGCYEQAAAMKPAFKVLYDKTDVVEQKMIDSRKWMDDAIFGDKQKKDIEFICSLVWHRLMQAAVAINRGALLRARGTIEYVRTLYNSLSRFTAARLLSLETRVIALSNASSDPINSDTLMMRLLYFSGILFSIMMFSARK